MFAIAAFGLLVAGILLRVVMKLSSRRRRRITIDRHDSDQIDGQLEHELEHKLHQDQTVPQRDALSEFLQRSPIPAENSNSRRPIRVGNDRPDITRARDSVSHITGKISMGERRRNDVEPRESERSDDRPRRGWREDQQRYESSRINATAPDRIDNRRQSAGKVDDVEPRESDRNDDRPRRGWREDQQRYESSRINAPAPDRIDNRRQRQERIDQQHGSAGEVDEVLDDLQRSLFAAASDQRPPHQANDEWANNGPGEDGASPNSDQIREREEALERLRRELDRLLQSPKVA
jgi:hypothetical protein